MRMMMAVGVASIALLGGCATTKTETPAASPGAMLDADPNTLQIEIGRYSALLGQVVEHTGVSYEHTAHDAPPEGSEALMAQLMDAVADYNAVRGALCASKAEPTYAAIRAASCRAALHPAWNDRGAPGFPTIARRSSDAGGHIIGLWDDVCAEARRLQPADQKDEPVCPME